MPERVQGRPDLEQVVPVELQERPDCRSGLKENAMVSGSVEPLDKALPQLGLQLKSTC